MSMENTRTLNVAISETCRLDNATLEKYTARMREELRHAFTASGSEYERWLMTLAMVGVEAVADHATPPGMK